MILRRTLLLSPLAAPALAQSLFSRPIRIVSPVVPGGAVDVALRTIMPKLQELLGQPMVLDNRPGGAGSLAADLVAHAPPDGHTLLLGTVGVVSVNPTLFRNLATVPGRDMAPVARLVDVANLLAVPTERPFASVAQLVAALKANPGKLSYGSAGIGSAGHLSGALLDHLLGTDAVHIPYRGGGQLITDLVSGKIDYAFATAGTVLPHVESGRLRALAVPTEARSRLMPTVPTMAEGGVPGYAINNWYGMLAPKDTPQPMVAALNAALCRAVEDPENVAKFATHGLEPAASTPTEFAAFIAAETTRYATVIRAARITGE